MKEFTIIHEPVTHTRNIDFTLEDIDQIYLGEGDCCRCGCAGTYATSDNPSLIKRRMSRFMKIYSDGYIGKEVKVKSIDNYIFEIEVSRHEGTKGSQVLTIYLKK